MRASRLLRILLLLQNRGRMTSAQLAEELEVARRTILRDVDALTEAGLPVIVHQGNQGGIELGFNYRTRLTGLAADEAEALAVMLNRPLGELAALGVGDAARRARTKLIESLPDPVTLPDSSLAERLTASLREATEMFIDDPELAAGVFAAMVARDPDIQRLRDAIGGELLRRLEVAAGPDPDPQVVWAALMVYSGAMLQAGMGYFRFDEVVAKVEAILAMVHSADGRPVG